MSPHIYTTQAYIWHSLDEAEGIIADYFGLEPDYLVELL